eukprot:12939118-Prorocentrum_lima.AAC.1
MNTLVAQPGPTGHVGQQALQVPEIHRRPCLGRRWGLRATNCQVHRYHSVRGGGNDLPCRITSDGRGLAMSHHFG